MALRMADVALVGQCVRPTAGSNDVLEEDQKSCPDPGTRIPAARGDTAEVVGRLVIEACLVDSHPQRRHHRAVLCRQRGALDEQMVGQSRFAPRLVPFDRQAPTVSCARRAIQGRNPLRRSTWRRARQLSRQPSGRDIRCCRRTGPGQRRQDCRNKLARRGEVRCRRAGAVTQGSSQPGERYFHSGTLHRRFR